MFSKRALLQSALALALTAAWPLAAQAQGQTVKIGVTPGPHAQLMERVQAIAAQDGLKIQIIEFSDYVQPNAALAAGDLDANSYQHKPYMDAQMQDRGYDFAVAFNTVNFPIGLYSKKVKSLDELKEGARFGIPNDPTNGGRVLLLLQAQGLIKLKDGADLKATVLDVVDNPKKLRFVELDAAQLPRSLDDLDASAINTNFAMSAGLNPKTDAIALEAADGPYVNIMVIRAADADQPWVAQLRKAYYSEELRGFVESEFKGSLLPSW